MEIKEIFVDGASRGNPGFASYAVIVYFTDGSVKKLGEVFEFKTNHAMEMLAACKAMHYIEMHPQESVVNIYSDSQVVVNMFNKNWIYNWEVKNTIENRPNPDLVWKILLQSYRIQGKFKLNWIPGHGKGKVQRENERNDAADKYCNELLNKYISGNLSNSQGSII